MANPEHLEILKRGLRGLNTWRIENPKEELDLQGADLSNLDLYSIGIQRNEADRFFTVAPNLTRANITAVNLKGAILLGTELDYSVLDRAVLDKARLGRARFCKARMREASLWTTDLRSAILTNADLQGADLFEANFADADLRGGNFSSAALVGTRIVGSRLSGAVFDKCEMRNALFCNVDLRSVHGLDTINHAGPSTIGIDTIYRSEGKIPESFLRGAGVPENFITFMKSLTTSAFEFYSAFISYSTKDQEFADRIYKDLQHEGVRCWFAPEDLKTGDELRSTFDEAIRVRDKLLLILSEHSVKSPWVKREVDRALDEENRRQLAGRKDWTVLFPIRIDDAIFGLPDAGWVSDVKRRHIGDFIRSKDNDAYSKAFERLLRDLKAESRAKDKRRGDN